MKKLIAVVLLAAGAMVAQYYSSGEELVLPDYRKWVYLGSAWNVVYPDEPRESAVQCVYAEPSAYDKFMKTGTWPDRTV